MNQSQNQSGVRQTAETLQFQLRLPDDLKARIMAVTEETGRSLNSEIVFALQEKFLPARLGAKAAMDLIGYIDAAQDDAQFFERLEETRYFLQMLRPGADISADREGLITITVRV